MASNEGSHDQEEANGLAWVEARKSIGSCYRLYREDKTNEIKAEPFSLNLLDIGLRYHDDAMGY